MKKLFTLSILFSTTFILQAQQLTVTQVATGFSSPTDIKHCGDDRLFIVERPGYIRIIDSTGATLPTPFLDIHTIVLSGTSWSERGLLGMAFDPHYSTNGYFYVNYTAQHTGTTHVSRCSVVPSTRDGALAGSETLRSRKT